MFAFDVCVFAYPRVLYTIAAVCLGIGCLGRLGVSAEVGFEIGMRGMHFSKLLRRRYSLYHPRESLTSACRAQ